MTTEDLVIYQTPDGDISINVLVENETVWLSQNQMGLLFDKDKRTISEHITNVFKEGELNENSVVRNFRTTASDRKTYDTNFYNLDVIISVGYRVKSKRGTQFRICLNHDFIKIFRLSRLFSNTVEYAYKRRTG